MIILGVLGALLIFLSVLTSNLRSDIEILTAGGALLCGFILFVALIGLPLIRMEHSAQIEQYKSVQKTVNQARGDGRMLEKATIQNKVVEMNRWRASVQYWNGTVFDLWVPDEVERLEPIR